MQDLKDDSRRYLSGKEIAEYLDVKALAGYLSVSEKSIWKWDHSRRLPGRTKMGRAVRWSRRAVDQRLLNGDLLLPVRKSKA